MRRISRRVDGTALPHAQCRYCHHEIVREADVGWFDPTPGATYDLCPDSRYGDHEPTDARGDLSPRPGLLM